MCRKLSIDTIIASRRKYKKEEVRSNLIEMKNNLFVVSMKGGIRIISKIEWTKAK